MWKPNHEVQEAETLEMGGIKYPCTLADEIHEPMTIGTHNLEHQTAPNIHALVAPTHKPRLSPAPQRQAYECPEDSAWVRKMDSTCSDYC